MYDPAQGKDADFNDVDAGQAAAGLGPPRRRSGSWPTRR